MIRLILSFLLLIFSAWGLANLDLGSYISSRDRETLTDDTK